MAAHRQQVLVLYLATSSLASHVVGWSSFDGASDVASEAGDTPEPPYSSGLDALRDGWRLFQASQLMPPVRGQEYGTSFQKFEFFFEKLIDPEATVQDPRDEGGGAA
jgi:hypothetical protein